jgi:hypothetical protein
MSSSFEIQWNSRIGFNVYFSFLISSCLTSMTNYKYDLRLNMNTMIDIVIEEFIKDKFEGSKIDLTFRLVSIASFVKTDFKRVDTRFKDFGLNFLKVLKEFSEMMTVEFEIDFIREAFSQLMLNNFSFSQSVLFPDKDIGMIKSKLQVELLLNGKNFILLPDILVKCSDIQFKFK